MPDYYESCGWAPFGLGKVKADGVGRCTGGLDLKDGKCETNDSVCGTHTTLNDQGRCVPGRSGCAGWATVLDERTHQCVFDDLDSAVGLQLIAAEFCRLNPDEEFCLPPLSDAVVHHHLPVGILSDLQTLPGCQNSFASPACTAAYRDASA
jgi:hypothetical protein